MALALFQVIGCRGTIEINPRSTMAKESSIMGVNLMTVTDVRQYRSTAVANFNEEIKDINKSGLINKEQVILLCFQTNPNE